MAADSALPESVLIAFDTIDRHINTLPDDTSINSRDESIIGTPALLITFSTKRNLRYPLGDTNG
jgi:hypothetical protein